MKLLYLGLVCLLCLTGSAFAQDRAVSGIVRSGDDNGPLPGANVTLKGSTRGTTTTADGSYKLTVPANATLVFSSVGYLRQEIASGNQTTLDVTLAADAGQLQEVVVTALGISQERKSLGYAVQTVSAQQIQSSGEQNLVSALQGKIAGAVITGSGGAPGAGTSIILRGVTSLGSGSSNQPLFVVDGIIISNNTVGGSNTPSTGSNSPVGAGNDQFGNTNRGADINPDDIADVSVLKGPAATALYGLRASNGAIVISTKRGQAGKPLVNLSLSGGMDEINKTPAIQTRFIQGRLGEFISPDDAAGRVIFRSFGPYLTPNNTTDRIYDNFRDFYRTGYRQNLNLSVSGGTDKATFYSSVGRFSQQGIVPGTKYSRTSLRLGGQAKLYDKLTVSGSVNYVATDQTAPPAGDKSIFSSLSYWPNSYDVNDSEKADGSQNNITAGTVDNPKFLMEKAPQFTKVNRFFGDLGLTYTITSWLTARYQATIDFYSEGRTRNVGSGFDVGSQVGGFRVDNAISNREVNSNLFLTAQYAINKDLRGSVMIGNSVVDINSPTSFVRGEGQVLEGYTAFNNYRNLFYGENAFRKRIVSGFFDAKIQFRDMLYLSVTGRNDQTSTLPKGNNSFFYPSVNLGYVFTESFKLGGNILTYGKLRASVAQVGKDTDPYFVGNYYAQTNGFPFNGQVGFRRDPVFADPNLKPETTTSTELGLELRFLQNRIGIDATYFVMDSKNQIFSVPVPNSSGASRYVTNAGLIRNRGLELLITGQPLKTSYGLTWDVALNFSRLRNTVITMPTAVQEIVYYDGGAGGRIIGKIVEGGSFGDLWGYDYRRDASGKAIIQTNGYPLVNDTKFIKVGNAFPDWQAGLNNTVGYKGISLSFQLEWRQGGNVVDMAEINSIRNGITRMTDRRYELVTFDGVRADGSTNVQQVVLDDNFYRSFSQYNAYYKVNLQDGSWFRLRNVALGYSLPKTLLTKTPFAAVRINVTGTNLFLNTPFRGYDPEALYFGAGTNLLGFVGNNNPVTRSYQAALNITF